MRSRLRRSLRHAHAFVARSRCCAPAASAACLPQALRLQQALRACRGLFSRKSLRSLLGPDIFSNILFVIFSYLEARRRAQLAARSAAAGARRLWQARVPAAGSSRLLRAPKARAWRGERGRHERVRLPAGVIFFCGEKRPPQARSACQRRAAPAAGAQHLLRAPKA